jgi:hypothetical protein
VDVEDTLAPGTSDCVAEVLVLPELETVEVVDADAPAGMDDVGVADVLAEKDAV